MNFRAVRDRVGPEAADRGISCERCHGPGGNHVAAVELKLNEMFIFRPAADDAPAVIRLCGQCHAPADPSMADPDHPFSIKFQAMTLVKSRCFTESQGAFHCITCHNPHRDASKDASYYESKCLSCHSPSKHKGKTACPVNPERNCLACHMPEVKGTIPHSPFTDHNIRIRHNKTAGVATSR